MITIKPWKSQTTPSSSLGEELALMQNEIDELRAALTECNKKIAKLETIPMMYRRMKFNAELQEELAAQRKTLEQVNQWFDWFHGDKTLDAPLSTEVADAIKEVLK